MNKKLSIRDLDLKNKRVLIRVDFNVPMDSKLNVTDDTRIRAALPTIKYAIDNGASQIILMSHLGRPKGLTPGLRMDPVAGVLQGLIGIPVRKLNDCVGIQTQGIKEKIILLENLRFHPEEEKNDPEFSKQLAQLGDVYINDAFGTSHRAHASTEGVTRYLPSAAGFLLEKEIEHLGRLLQDPKRPFVAILGGAKVSDKVGVIQNFTGKVDKILIGGGMAYTFIKAEGGNIGNSKLEKDSIPIAQSLLADKRVKIVLPIDHVVEENGRIKTVGKDIPDGCIALDIGPETRKLFKNELAGAKTVVWNGPLGMFERKEFMAGTQEIAEFLTSIDAITVIGGGDTAAAISELGLENKMTHVSTGGGASLEFMEGKELPGIAALQGV